MWVKLPTWELRAVELRDQDGLSDLLVKVATMCYTIGRLDDVSAVFERRVLRQHLSLAQQGVKEGSVIRLQFRLRGGAPRNKGGQPMCYVFEGGECFYGDRRQYKHEPTKGRCPICGSSIHGQKDCARHGGGEYVPSQDPTVLALAERKAAKAWQVKAFTKPGGKAQIKRPAEPSHPPPPWIRNSGDRPVVKEPTPPLRFTDYVAVASDNECVDVEVAVLIPLTPEKGR